MKKYSCEYCNYSTDDIGNWCKHKKSQKHLKNNNKDIKTTYVVAQKSSKLLQKGSILLLQKCNEPDEIKTNNALKINKDPKTTYEQTTYEKTTYEKTENEDIIKNLKCAGCDKNFLKKYNLERHEKICVEKKHNLLENQFEIYKKEKDMEYQLRLMEEKLKMMEEKNLSLEKEKTTMREHIDTLKTENNFQKQIINCAGGLVQKSMNTMSYLLLNFDNAPQLKSLADYSIISKDMESLIKDLIHYHRKGKFDKYIGDFIIKQYKKEDPNLQALWSSDVERLNYFIRELINNKNIDQPEEHINLKEKKCINWIVDKKGIKVKKCIIDPLLDYINKIAIIYLNEKNKKLSQLDVNNVNNLLIDMQEVGLISSGIKNKTIANTINKYIAPHFYLNKDNKN